MNYVAEPREGFVRRMARTTLNIVLLAIPSVIPLYLLLFSGFIVFVPIIVFFVWLWLQMKNQLLKRNWKLSLILFICSALLTGISFWWFSSTKSQHIKPLFQI